MKGGQGSQCRVVDVVTRSTGVVKWGKGLIVACGMGW